MEAHALVPCMPPSHTMIQGTTPQVAPVLDHQPLDLWALFRTVAASGGYQAVSARRCRADIKQHCCPLRC